MIVFTCVNCKHYIPHTEKTRRVGKHVVKTFTCINCGHETKRVR